VKIVMQEKGGKEVNNLNELDAQKVMLLRLIPTVYEKSNHPVGHRPSYQLKYIEALLREQSGYSIDYVDQQITSVSVDDIEERIDQWKPHVVVFDVTTLNTETSGILCKKLSEKTSHDEIICIGIGQEVSANVVKFREKYPHYCICLAGEAELEVVSTVEKFKQGSSIEELKKYYMENELGNRLWIVKGLDSLPFLHFDEKSLRAYNFVYPLRLAKKLIWGHMITSRGCPHPCIFCSQLMRESYSTKVRFRSAGNVVDEMEHLLGLGANIIAFDDDDFTISDKHVRLICHEILNRRLKVKWIVHSRLDELDELLLKLMGESGCILIRVGIESGNKRILNLLKKTKKKDAWFEKSKTIVRSAQSYGISVAGLFMVGSPTETKEEMLESIEFAKKLALDIIQVSYFTPFPGTKAYDLYKDKIPNLKTEDLYHYNVPKFNLSSMSNDDLKKAQKLFYRKFLLRPPFIMKHIFNNFLFYLANPEIFLRLLRSLKKFN